MTTRLGRITLEDANRIIRLHQTSVQLIVSLEGSTSMSPLLLSSIETTISLWMTLHQTVERVNPEVMTAFEGLRADILKRLSHAQSIIGSDDPMAVARSLGMEVLPPDGNRRLQTEPGAVAEPPAGKES